MSRFGTLPILDELRDKIDTRNLITRLIIVNVVVYLALNIAAVIGWIASGTRVQGYDVVVMIINWIGMPGDLGEFATRPWTLITHMFTHYGIFHLVMNMMVLFMMGGILNEYIGPRKVLPLYFYGGIAGGIIFLLSASFIPFLHQSHAIGASAAILAITAAVATLLPDHEVRLRIFGRVKLKYLAAVLIGIDVLSLLFNDDNTGGHIAHLAGALFGFIYIRQIKVGHDLSRPFNAVFDFFADMPDRFRKRRQPHMVYKRMAKVGPRLNTPAREKQAQVDELLDKINRSGYESLTKEEKAFLFRASKEE
jgi:membrane associated rhomboid family serine protease